MRNVAVVLFWVSAVFIAGVYVGIHRFVPQTPQMPQMEIIELEPNLVSSQFLTALAEIESEGNARAIGAAGELGMYQITPICLRDCNRIVGHDIWSLDDRIDPLKSRSMARVYLDYWGERIKAKGYSVGPKQLLAIWRWGPGWRPDLENHIDVDRAAKLRKIMNIRNLAYWQHN